MQAFVLAAGMGTRISGDINGLPKSLLKINGVPILVQTIEHLLSLGIRPTVCTGYRSKDIEEALSQYDIEFRHNPFYAVSNNIASLWFCADRIGVDDSLIISGDLLFDPEILQHFYDEKRDLVLSVDSSKIDEGDYFLHLTETGGIVSYGADLNPEERDCENVGIAFVSKHAADTFIKRLNSFIDNEKINEYYEMVFFSFIEDENIKLSTFDIAGHRWLEIDSIADYELAQLLY